MPRITNADRLLAAFIRAGDRGLKPAQMDEIVGPGWRAAYQQLKDANAVFHVEKGRYATRAGFFRAILRAEPSPAVEEPDTPVQGQLMDVPVQPASALVDGERFLRCAA